MTHAQKFNGSAERKRNFLEGAVKTEIHNLANNTAYQK